MRILHLIDHLGLGGAQVALADLLASWRGDDRFEVLGLGRRDELIARFDGNERVVVGSLGFTAWNPRALTAVERVVAQGNYDLVHAHLRKASAAALWAHARSSIPVVLHVHGDPRHDAVLRWVLNLGKDRAAAALVVSRQTASAVIRTVGFPAGRLRIVGNPIDLNRLEAESADAASVRRGLGLGDATLLIGFVGRLSAEKAPADLLAAVAELRHRDEDVAAAFVGDGPLAGALASEARRLGIADVTHLVGRQSQAAAWIKACDVLALPSRTEGLPLTVLEAFALETPVAAARVGGIPEVVRDGQTGLLVPTGDVTALGRSILQLARSAELRRSVTSQARRLVVANYAGPQVARQVREVYQTVLGETGNGPDSLVWCDASAAVEPAGLSELA